MQNRGRPWQQSVYNDAEILAIPLLRLERVSLKEATE